MTVVRKHAFTTDVATTAEEIQEARRFQAARYLEVGFVTSTAVNGMIEDQWVASSTYHVARHESGRVVGVCRFVNLTLSGLPMLSEFDLYAGWRGAIAANCGTAYEMGALAVDPEFKDTMVSASLYRQTIRQFRVHPGQVHLLAALDSGLLEVMRDVLHFPFTQIGDPKMLVGGESTPVYLYVPDALQRQIDLAPDAARYFCGCDDLDIAREEVLDLRSTYTEIRPEPVEVDLTDPVQLNGVQVNQLD